ncbi:regulator of G-protein signaling 3-like isoform X2 [Mercenaria mercenaria]|uniref:regulator of G-protein signaling 3-like isoform X2 n=1 Tax=Mercenaria mercenaria TaxID=6596 RepID=UPI00234EDBCC|nr:regulator of G-protein signaling 3-like isoform X2 [Mercenaria mercenaria]
MGIHMDDQGSPISPVISPVRTAVSPVFPIISAGSRPARSEGDVVSMRHGVTVTKIPKNKIDNTVVPKPHNRRFTEDPVTQKSISSVVKQTEGIQLDESDLTNKRVTDEIQKCNIDRRGRNRPRLSLPVPVTLRVDEDEGLDVGDSNSDLFIASSQECLQDSSKQKQNNLDKDLLHVDTEESSGEESSDSENVEFSVSSETEGKTAEHVKRSKVKDSKKKKLQSLLPLLKRSQSLGCNTDLVQEDSEHAKQCMEGKLSVDKMREAGDVKRMIHKTCSADAAMMATDVLPIDPQEFVKNKQKSSIAKNMRKKFQKLKRRNTDSLLGAAILSVRGTTKITQSNAIEWATSFEALLYDKNGLEMFRNFLKSEFSEENIEFWVACEEFKTVRTNKLVSRAQKIYSDFIAIKSPKQVNLDSKTRLQTVTSLENPTRDIFKEAQKRIQFLMENDSYKRFIDSDAYKYLIRRNSSTDGR